jgi:hypothetical protein
MSEKQKQVLHFMLGEALDSAKATVKQDNIEQSNDSDKEGKQMPRNVFEKGGQDEKSPVLSHADIQGIVADATRTGSLKASVENMLSLTALIRLIPSSLRLRL